MRPRLAVNVAQHKIVNSLKTLGGLLGFVSVYVLNVWPRTTLLPVGPRDAERLDTPEQGDPFIPGGAWPSSGGSPGGGGMAGSMKSVLGQLT